MKTQPYNQAEYSVPTFHTIPGFLDGISKLYGPRPALSWFTRRREQQTLTYAQLTQKVSNLRKCLLQAQLD